MSKKPTPMERIAQLIRLGLEAEREGQKVRKGEVVPRMTRTAAVGPEWEKFRGVRKECPRCGKTKDGLTEFGPRKIRGKPSLQSYCRKCRSDGTPRVK